MRYSILAFAFFASTFAFPQSMTTPGASLGPGTYAHPVAPRVSTPVASFARPRLQVGASNATEGNSAGAGSLTVPQDSTLESDQLLLSLLSASPSGEAEATAPRSSSTGFNTGASMPQDAFGVARLIGGRSANKASVRTFTNADVQQMHDAEAK